MPKRFRVYAKVLAYSLPKEPTEIAGCVIHRMSFAEQRKRGFKPLNIKPATLTPASFYKSYMSFGTPSDTRIFKTGYVIYTDIDNREAHDTGGLIGVAIRRFDKVAGALSLASADWFSKTHNRPPLYKSCDYQISRIYELKDDEEAPIEPDIVRGGGSQINLPAANVAFSSLDHNLIQRILDSREPIFKRALRYLLSSERALYLGLPMEKVMLDLIKSIEIVVKSFGGRNRKTFKQRLKICAKKIGLTEEEQGHITDLWKARNRGDVAHAREQSWAEFLPPQYPVPSDVEMNAYFRSDLGVAVLLKFFDYKDGETKVELDSGNYWGPGSFVDVNMGSYYAYHPHHQERRNMVAALKRQLANKFNVKIKDVTLRFHQGKEFIFKIRR
ncbi:MAG TPA: hypothetical protein VG753_00355 [Candidatus Paceibacterota bacterium]|nr:hypothetical protein [Candidatus Paceibacterota bacterium]